MEFERRVVAAIDDGSITSLIRRWSRQPGRMREDRIRMAIALVRPLIGKAFDLMSEPPASEPPRKAPIKKKAKGSSYAVISGGLHHFGPKIPR